MSTAVDEYLAHYGVEVEDDELKHYGKKGMKWGVRNDNDGGGKTASPRKMAKLDAKFEKGISQSTYFKVYNKMADRMNDVEIDRINNMPQFKGKAPLDDPKLSKAYLKEYSNTATRLLNEASKEIIGTNASGTREVRFTDDPNSALPGAQIVDVKSAKHADESAVAVKLEVKNGFITKISFADVIQHADIVDATLAHYGVPGMKWGKRRNGADVSERKLSKMNRSADRGDERVSKAGTARSAALRVIGREAATQVLGRVGTNVVANLSGNPKVAIGLKLASNLALLATATKSTNDLIDIDSSVNRRNG